MSKWKRGLKLVEIQVMSFSLAIVIKDVFGTRE